MWSFGILGAIDQIFNFITSGSIGGLPPIVLMIIIFVIGLIVGLSSTFIPKNRHYSCYYTLHSCILRLLGFKSQHLEKLCNPIRINRISIWGTHHRHTTAKHWIHNRRNHRIRICLNSLPEKYTVKVERVGI